MPYVAASFKLCGTTIFKPSTFLFVHVTKYDSVTATVILALPSDHQARVNSSNLSGKNMWGSAFPRMFICLSVIFYITLLIITLFLHLFHLTIILAQNKIPVENIKIKFMVCDECASMQIRLMSLLCNRLSVQMFSLFSLVYRSVCFSLLSSEQDYHECRMYLKSGMVSSLDDARLKKIHCYPTFFLVSFFLTTFPQLLEKKVKCNLQ